MATSLSGKSIGAPDNAFAWYLQSGGGTLAAGFPVALGNGDETPLYLHEDGVGIRSAGGFVSMIVSLATSARDLEMADADGVIQPALQAVTSSDQTNATTTAAAITDLTVDLEASSLYEFEAVLLVKSAATTTGVQVRVTGPTAQTSWVTYDISHPTTTTPGTNNIRAQNFSAFDSNFAATDAPAANTVFPIYVRGVIKTTGSAPATPLGFSFNSEVAASTVTIVAGTFLRCKRIG